MKRYNPAEIEAKWQKKWEEDGTYAVDFSDHSKPKYYGFSMLPGITGAGIHIGHGRTFQFSDIKVRAKRQQGYNAYNPIGWDSFGLPVENYAIKVGKKPREAHDDAKVHFKQQLKRLGYSYDWSKEISTADPHYYRWTQWIFNKLYEHDLAYQKEQPQWWCENDSTVLANEQVEGGKCWRCGQKVTKRNLKQWFFRITAYADEILEATDELDWTPMVKTMQKNWIGKSKGAEVDFEIVNDIAVRDSLKFTPELTEAIKSGQKTSTIRLEPKQLQVGDYAQFFTRHDAETVERFGKARVVDVRTLALRDIPNNLEGHASYDTDAQKLADFKKFYGDDINESTQFTIYDFEYVKDVITVFTTRADTLYGATFMVLAPEHPLVSAITTEDQRSAVEAYIAEAQTKSDVDRMDQNREKTGVFTGAYAINPLTNERIPVWVADYVLMGYGTGAIMAVPAHDERDGAFAAKFGIPSVQVIQSPHDDAEQPYHGDGTLINSGPYDGVQSAEAREQIVAHLAREGKGTESTQYKMRDWLISRQRYWGAPIPIVHCEHDGAVPVPDDQLPVLLPDVDDYRPTGGNTSVLAGVTDWVNTTCPKCGGPAKRETDTMDGYACSSWYFLRYLDPFNDQVAWDVDQIKYWGPVDFYNGADHAVAHLLYARFWMRFFYKLGLVGTPEPFKRMMYNAYIMAPDGQKMSKSKGNVIDPLEIMDSGYGADSLRLYEMFIAPYDQEAPWDARGVPGTYRFLSRVWTLVQQYLEAVPGQQSTDDRQTLLTTAHKTVKKVTEDIEGEKFNTAVSSMMEAVNTYYKLKNDGKLYQNDDWRFALESLLMVLSPFTPHITEELWSDLGHADTIHVDHWPEWDESYLVEDTVTIVVQVNGKLRAELHVAKTASREELQTAALAHERIRELLGDQAPTRIVVVPGRLVNIVIAR